MCCEDNGCERRDIEYARCASKKLEYAVEISIIEGVNRTRKAFLKGAWK